MDKETMTLLYHATTINCYISTSGLELVHSHSIMARGHDTCNLKRLHQPKSPLRGQCAEQQRAVISVPYRN
jgi:hypothetical protein